MIQTALIAFLIGIVSYMIYRMLQLEKRLDREYPESKCYNFDESQLQNLVFAAAENDFVDVNGTTETEVVDDEDGDEGDADEADVEDEPEPEPEPVVEEVVVAPSKRKVRVTRKSSP